MTLQSFSLDPAGEQPLSVQLVDCIRQKIARGEYGPGDVLPGVRDLARVCGTSTRVPMAAFATLASEGLVKPRPRIGCVVLGKDRKVWRGRIIIIRNVLVNSYSEVTYRESIASRLMMANWRVETLSISYKKDFITPELAALRRMLTERADLVVFMGNDIRMIEIINAAGIPYITSGISHPLSKGHVGRTVLMWRGLVMQFAAECEKRGIRRVLRVRTSAALLDEQGEFRRRGIEIQDAVVVPGRSDRMLEAFRRCGYEAVRSRLQGKRTRPDLILFCDDYLTAGGLMALAECGLKAPDDIKIVTLSNAGNCPFYPRDLTRFEVDAWEDANKLVHAVLQFLEKGVLPGTVMFSARYVRGETF